MPLGKPFSQGMRNGTWLEEEEKATRVCQNLGCWRGLGELGTYESDLIHLS